MIIDFRISQIVAEDLFCGWPTLVFWTALCTSSLDLDQASPCASGIPSSHVQLWHGHVVTRPDDPLQRELALFSNDWQVVHSHRRKSCACPPAISKQLGGSRDSRGSQLWLCALSLFVQKCPCCGCGCCWPSLVWGLGHMVCVLRQEWHRPGEYHDPGDSRRGCRVNKCPWCPNGIQRHATASMPQQAPRQSLRWFRFGLLVLADSWHPAPGWSIPRWPWFPLQRILEFSNFRRGQNVWAEAGIYRNMYRNL